MTKSRRKTINISLLITFLEKIYFIRKHIWKILVYIVTFVLQFLRLAGYWKAINKIPTPIYICTGLVDAVL